MENFGGQANYAKRLTRVTSDDEHARHALRRDCLPGYVTQWSVEESPLNP